MTSTTLAHPPNSAPAPGTGLSLTAAAEEAGYTRDHLALLKRTIAPGIDDDTLALALYDARRRGLDLLAGQLHLVRFRNRDGSFTWSRQVAIDGYRLIAARTGEYAGSDDAVFTGLTHAGEDGKLPVPAQATITVWRLVQGQRCPYVATARWAEYYPGAQRGVMWHRMPHTMLAKVAEALALRKAFPAELSGLDTEEEGPPGGARARLAATGPDASGATALGDDLEAWDDPVPPATPAERAWYERWVTAARAAGLAVELLPAMATAADLQQAVDAFKRQGVGQPGVAGPARREASPERVAWPRGDLSRSETADAADSGA